MARAGLGTGWKCLFSNDFNPLKARVYRDNWPAEDLVEGDVWALRPEQLPGRADLAWASSPCQDFSLAGTREGLLGNRSSAFWGFWNVIEGLRSEDRAPRTIVIENVMGILSSHIGADFTALCSALSNSGYLFGAIEVDASMFVPQSRPRVFILATREPIPPSLNALSTSFHTTKIRQAFARLPDPVCQNWVWWNPGAAKLRNADLGVILEPDDGVRWHSTEQTERLIELMGATHKAKVASAAKTGSRRVGAIFRRMRVENGTKVQRAEIRFDGVAGCLRTPRGGSSRQFIMVVNGENKKTRALTSIEGARLMGLGPSYKLPKTQIGAFEVLGDGVVVDVVSWIATTLVEPILSGRIDYGEEEDGRRARA